MEFRYRAIDVDRPRPATDTALTQSSNPNFSFFSTRPVQGTSGDHVLEAIQREIEKEQIRQEIVIAEETARRKELIAEVVQEMAIEREMGIRRVADKTGMLSLEENLTMWINEKDNNLFRQKCSYSDHMMYSGPYSLDTSPMMELPPIQQMPDATGAKETSTMVSNEEKLIILSRPESVGAKGKAEDTQTCLGTTKRKADGVERGLNESFQRKRLKSKERDMEMKQVSVRNTAVETGETASSKLPCLGKQIETVESKPKFKFWCDICNVGAFCETVMKSHELGKKHKSAVEKQNAIASFNNTPTPVTVPQSEAITLLEMAAKETGNKTEGEKKKKVTLWCETCKIRTHSEQMMETHKLGKKHKALIEKQLMKPLAVIDTNLITVQVRSLNDDQGDKA